MIRVLLVDDETLVRVGLKALIPWEEHGFTVVGEAANGRDALEQVGLLHPDLVLTDIRMPVMDGIELIQQLLAPGGDGTASAPVCVALSCFDEYRYVRSAMKAGAADYLVKSDIQPEILLEGLRSVRSLIDARLNRFRQERQVPEALIGNLDDRKHFFWENVWRDGPPENPDRELAVMGFRTDPDDWCLLDIRIDDFPRVRAKYGQANLHILRQAMRTILAESLGGSLRGELFEAAPEHWLAFINPCLDGTRDTAMVMEAQAGSCQRLRTALTDFLNLSVSIGCSALSSGFHTAMQARAQAAAAVGQRFFQGPGTIRIHTTSGPAPSVLDADQAEVDQFLTGAIARLRSSLEDWDEASVCLVLDETFTALRRRRAGETEIRLHALAFAEAGYYLTVSAGLSGHQGNPRATIQDFEQLEPLLAWLRAWLCDIIRLGVDSATADSRTITERARDIIRQRFDQDLSLASVAGELGITPAYLSRLFKAETGSNFLDHLTRLRMEKARHYLESGRLRINEVAQKVGYPNESWFSKLFKRQTGLSPEEYKNAHEKDKKGQGQQD